MIQINNNNFYTISEINEFIKELFYSVPQFKNIGLIGEVSNYKGQNRSGHCYFTLKDDNSTLSAVIFKYDFNNLDFDFKNGDEILVIGSISCYDKNGTYQIIINKVFPYGKGKLLLKREELKNKLLKLGYFNNEHKKRISAYPIKIAIITGLNSAASADIRKNLKRRWPIAELYEFNTIVQGEQASKDILRGLNEAYKINPDAIIIGRGGGSSEDLSAFDDEELVKALYECPFVTISAVGHEINQSFCDLVCDYYASTPTGACEIAVPDMEEVINDIEHILNHILDKVNYYIKNNEMLIMKIINNKQLFNVSLLVEKQINRIKEILNRIIQLSDKKIISFDAIIKENLAKINSIDPNNILSKGFSLVYKGEKLVKSKDDINLHDRLILKLKDSDIEVEVTKK